MPRIADNRGNGQDNIFFTFLNRVVKIYFLLLFPASIGLIGVSKQFMLIFGTNYMAWTNLMIVFAAYTLTCGVQGIISNQIIYLYKKEYEDVKIFFICGAFNVVGNFLLLLNNMFSPTNSIIVTMISNIFVIIMEYSVIKKKLKLNIKLFGFDNMKYFYYSLLCIPITFIINKYVGSIIISCAIDVFLSASIYLSILFVTKDEVFFYLYNMCYEKTKVFIKRKI